MSLLLTVFLLVATSQGFWSFRPSAGITRRSRAFFVTHSNNNNNNNKNHNSYHYAPTASSALRLAASPSTIDEEVESLDVMTLTLKIRCAEIFETLETSPDKGDVGAVSTMNFDLLSQWEDNVASLCSDLRLLTDRVTLLEVYSAILSMAAPNMLDPLQMSTFENVSTYLSIHLSFICLIT
jgi:hypothetical protein